MSWAAIATWPFALGGISSAGDILSHDGGCLDAVVEAIEPVESDPGVESVGFAAVPNRDGEVELDAAVMRGRDLSLGAVAGVKGYLHPVVLARLVMQNSPHNLLVGEGAEEFARSHGLEKAILVTDKSRAVWEERRARAQEGKPFNRGHDTIGVVALDARGEMACGTSTSGTALKHPGRVGDSPLVGSGFYVDDEVGGATATGLGEDIMRGCLCFSVVEMMRQGLGPREAAEKALARILKRLTGRDHNPPGDAVGYIAIVALAKNGAWGAATNGGEFQFAVATDRYEPAVRRIQGIYETGHVQVVE